MGDFEIRTDITINGATRATTIIDGGQLDRIFDFSRVFSPVDGSVISVGKLALNRMTLRNGRPGANFGGAIRAFIATPLGQVHLSLNDVAVTGNQAASLGGAILTAVTTALTDVVITGNTADGSGGGVVVWIGISATMTRVTVSDNLAQQLTVAAGDSSGGGLSLSRDSVVTITDSTISNNTSVSPRNGEAGGIANSGTLTMNNVVVSGNKAITNVDNSAAFAGGIENAGGTIVMNGGALTNNCAARDAAACAQRSPTGLNVNGDGGGLVNIACRNEACTLTGPGIVTLNGVLLDQNYAQDNGGAMNSISGTVNLNGATLSGNLASVSGGGVYNQNSSLLKVASTTIHSNTATSEGGGIYNLGNAEISGSTISSNSATGGNGGGIQACATTGVSTPTLKIINSTVSGDSAPANRTGGGLCLTATETDLSFVTIAGNTAGTGGGV